MLKYSLPTTVASILSGLGTLGLPAALGRASRVVLNDAWLPAAVEDDGET